MKITKVYVFDQNSDQAQNLATKNNTTTSMCGYIVCGVCDYLTQQKQITKETLIKMDFKILEPYIEKAMKAIAVRRKIDIKKFYNQMNDQQRKNYIRDWVANYQLSDYLESISGEVVNDRLYFFRQSAYDHPDAMALVKFQQAERIKQQKQFQGQKYFYTSFAPQINKKKEQFAEDLKKQKNQELPIIIATDVLGHFNTTVILQGNVYILDSLRHQSQYDENIVYKIYQYYKQSFLKQ